MSKDTKRSRSKSKQKRGASPISDVHLYISGLDDDIDDNYKDDNIN